MFSSPRMRSYNISYVEQNTTEVTKPFPILWMETHAFATTKELAAMDKVGFVTWVFYWVLFKSLRNILFKHA